jgi:malate/lactate dehydrogenase
MIPIMHQITKQILDSSARYDGIPGIISNPTNMIEKIVPTIDRTFNIGFLSCGFC